MDDRMIGLSDDRKVASLVRDFRDLEVYKRAYGISLTVHKASLEFPKSEQYALADQIRRASKSICANIAEGFAKQQSSKAEFKRFLIMSIGSAHEMSVWTDYARDLGYLTEETARQWFDEYQSVTRMLQALYSKF